MRTREEILEAIRILETASAGATVNNDPLMVVIVNSQIGVLKWAIKQGPQSDVFQENIDKCHAADAAQAKARAN